VESSVNNQREEEMNATHLHLILNHIPVLGTAFGLGLLAWGLWRRSEEVKRSAFAVFVLIALFAIPTYLTGEPAEDGVKGLPGVSSPIIERHEEVAGVALTGVLVLGIGALASLLWFRAGKLIPAWLSVSFLVASLTASGLAAWTANLGGQVRHTEIRSGANANALSESAEREHD
jgi:hypothetical protein